MRQSDLDRALMEAISTGLAGVGTCTGFRCLAEVERQLVSDCSSCLSQRQHKIVPSVMEPDYTRVTASKKGMRTGGKGTIASDCTNEDVQMFCLHNTFPARFFKQAAIFGDAVSDCFPHLEKARTAC